MSEFQFYKKRDFSSFMGDTISFFKYYGKDFVKNFMIINGLLLVAVCVLYYLFFKDFMSNTMSGNPAESWMMYEENIGLLVLFSFLFFAIMVVYSIISMAFPMVYTRLAEKTGGNVFTSAEIFKEIRAISGKIFMFGLISFFILMPLYILLFALGAVLSILLVGIVILIIAMPAAMVWSMQSMYVYVYEGKGYFDSLKKGWKCMFSNFWNIIGATLAMYMLIMVVQSVITFIPMMYMMAKTFNTGGNPDMTSFPPLMMLIYAVSIFLTFILINLTYVQQALIYYSSIEATESIQAGSEIDNIGNNAE